MEVCVEKRFAHNESVRLSYRGYGMICIMGLSVFVRQDEMADSILRRRRSESIRWPDAADAEVEARQRKGKLAE